MEIINVNIQRNINEEKMGIRCRICGGMSLYSIEIKQLRESLEREMDDKINLLNIEHSKKIAKMSAFHERKKAEALKQ